MKKIIAVLATINILYTSCKEACIQNVYSATIVVDVSDTTITNQFKREASAVIEKLSLPTLKRCEGVQVIVEAIGATIENQSATVSFPANGTFGSNLGNYQLSDSNNAKNPVLLKGLVNTLVSFKAIGDNQSQIFYTLTQILNNKKGKVVIYTDLIEFYGGISFYNIGFDFEKTYEALLRQYSMGSVQTMFDGTITIVSPMEKNQDKILKAREFFKFYFQKRGIAPTRFEFVGSVTQSKL